MTVSAAPPAICTELRGAVLLLRINRPERMNAWSDAVEAAYFSALDAADDNPDVRAVVLTGEGRAFCAGADLDELAEANPDFDLSRLDRARPRTRPLEFRKPLIAAINGAAAGLGLVQALYCDLRFSKPTAKLTTAFARRGLIAEYGIAWMLPRLVGSSRALDLLYSARVVTAEQAAPWGLIDELADDPVESAMAYAEELSTHCSPASMAIIKGQVRRDLDRDFGEAVIEADRLMRESLVADDVGEGVRSYLEKRPPAFRPLPSRS